MQSDPAKLGSLAGFFFLGVQKECRRIVKKCLFSQELATYLRNRGKTPGKRKLLIQWAKPRSRILSTARLCWHQSRLCRLGKTRFRSSSCFCFGVSRLSTSILPTTGKRAHNLPQISKRCHPLRVPGFLPLLPNLCLTPCDFSHFWHL